MVKFRATEGLKTRGKWTALPESALRVYLTCPVCRHRYPLVHEFCGMHVEVATALSPRTQCTACAYSGQVASLPVGIADCPNCGLECRAVEEVEGAESIARSVRQQPIQKNSRPRSPRIIGPCSVCGSHYGIHTHHVDWNHNNNEPGNRVTICHWCHEQADKLGKPLFDKLIERVEGNPEEKERLRRSSIARHNELFGPSPDVQQPRLFG